MFSENYQTHHHSIPRSSFQRIRFTFNRTLGTRFQNPKFPTGGNRERRKVSQIYKSYPGQCWIPDRYYEQVCLYLWYLYPQNLPIAGRLRHFFPNWELITHDTWILQVVQGYRMDLLEDPVQVSPPRPIVVSKENRGLLESEVQKLVTKKAIHLVQSSSTERGFLSNQFLVPKKGEEQHPVVNLKPLKQMMP